MIINRHNYEEFFLLYADGELDADEQTAVENFVKDNPDLAKELDLLKQATLKDDTIQFEQKELLYKKENGISLANYEEYFLLYADKELNEQEVAQTDQFVLKHPQLQNEFTLLQRTRLEPELIEFAGKATLHRNKEKQRRTIPVAWMRVSAAAAIISLIAVTWIFSSHNEIIPGKAVSTSAEKPLKTSVEKIEQRAVQKSAPEKFVAASEAKMESENNLKKATAITRKPGKYAVERIKAIRNSKEAATANKSKTNLERETVIADNSAAITETTIDKQAHFSKQGIKISNSSDPKIMSDHHSNGTDNVMVKQSLVDEQPALAAHAVYLDIDNDEEEKSVYIGGAEINKNKLKGLFKKAAGFLNKKVRPNDD